jgi:predicted chitinase
MQLYYGVVENRKDPLKLGRCQVRIVGLHTHDKAVLPTDDLPWATPMQPVTSAAMNGIGWSPVGPVEGTSVIITFADLDQQQPIMLGTIGGIPQSKAASIALEDSGNIATDGGVITAPDGKPLTGKDGTPTTLGNRVEAETKKVTTAVNQEVQNIKNKMAALTAAAFGDKFGDLFGTVKAAAIETKTLPVQGAADEGKPTIIPPAPAPADTNIKAQPTPGKADDKILQTPINLEPMPKYVAKGEEGKAKQCIAALVAACDKVGLTSKYAKASILGICGGETGWVPKEEGHVYSKPQSLLSIFPSIFKGDLALATEYSGGKKTKAEFFELIYGYKFPKGQGLGNKAPGDGGKYYGRGFNQLTGKSNYTKTQAELKQYGITVDLINQPQLLNDDINVAALACVLFYKNHPTLKNANSDDPGYFVKARAATGADAGGGYEKKQIMYEYFLGQGVLASSTTRGSAEDETGKKYTAAEVSQLPKEKQDALLEDRTENATIGFKDPKGKYPLRNLMNEPDTNRLARGVIQETAIAYKDQTRTTGIPTPFGGSFEQPIAPFGGVYPYAKVYETETGHVMMFDDSTGHETISLYHRKGSFLDIDANGTQVNKIVGDGYTIYDRNGSIYVAGKCNLTVGNSVNILVQGDANIEVNGQTQAVFHGQVDIGCAEDVNMAIGGDWNISVAGSINTQIGKDKVTTVVGNENTGITGSKLTTVGGDNKDQVTGAITSKAGGYIAVETADEYTVKAAGVMKHSGTEQHIKASGNVNIDGAELHGQEGSAVEADAVESVDNISAAVIAAPSGATANGDKFDPLTTPVRPSTPVDVKVELVDDFLNQAKNATINPDLEAAGVGAAGSKPQPVTSSDPPAGETQSIADGDLVAFLKKQEQLGKEGYWTERAMSSGRVEDSNPNIIAIWKDIGLFGPIITTPVAGKSGYSAGGDQTAWCMAFATWCLKQTGHKWVKTASAADATNQMAKFGFTKVTDKPQNGDVMHIKFQGGGNHVAFVWDVRPDGKFSMLGGNQGGSSSGNNPSGGQVKASFNGLVTMSGYSGKGAFDVIGIYRPFKV